MRAGKGDAHRRAFRLVSLLARDGSDYAPRTALRDEDLDSYLRFGNQRLDFVMEMPHRSINAR